MTHSIWKAFALCAAWVASGAAQAAVTLFQYDNFGGQRIEVTGPVPNLARLAFNDSANSIVIERGTWQLCIHADFQGSCVTLGPGQYPTLRQIGMNDTISSLRPVGPGSATPGPAGTVDSDRAPIALYLHDDFQGGSLGLDGPAPDLRQYDANDKASSLVVRRGHWQVCSDVQYAGQCVVFGPGRYPSMRPFGLNDAISSVRPGGRPDQAVGADLLLFEHDQFGGRRVASNADIVDLARLDFGHDVSSVVIERGTWELCSAPGYRGQCIVLGPGRHPSMRPYGLNDAIASARRSQLAPSPGFGPGGPGGPRHGPGGPPLPIPAYDPVAACVHAAESQLRSEHPRARQIQVEPGSVRSRVERSGTTVVRGDGEIDSRRGTRRFRFECEADGSGPRLTRLRYEG